MSFSTLNASTRYSVYLTAVVSLLSFAVCMLAGYFFVPSLSISLMITVSIFVAAEIVVTSAIVMGYTLSPAVAGLVACMVMSLPLGVTNAFQSSFIASNMGDTTDLSPTQITLLSSMGILGLFLTIPAGFLNDRFGPFKTIFVCGPILVASLAGMSFTGHSTYVLMLSLWTLTGFMCGAIFTCTLATGVKSMPESPGTGIAFVATCLSISLVLVNIAVSAFGNLTDCPITSTTEECWKESLRFWAAVSFVFVIPFNFLLLLLPKENANTAAVEVVVDGEDKTADTFLNTRNLNTDQHAQVAGGGARTRKFPQSSGLSGAAEIVSIPGITNIEPDSSFHHHGSDGRMESDFYSRIGEGENPHVPPGYEDQYAEKVEGDKTPLTDRRKLAPLRRSETKTGLLHSALTEPVPMDRSVLVLGNVFFICLIVAFFCGIGQGLIVLTQGTTLWGDFASPAHAHWIQYITDLFSVSNAFCNVMAGIIGDRLFHQYGFTRRRLIALVLVYSGCCVLGLVLIPLIPGPHSLVMELVYAAFLIGCGAGFGTYLTLLPAVVGDLYGGRNFGVFFGYLQIGPTLSTFIVPNVSQAIYEARGSFMIALVPFSLMCFASALGLWFKDPTLPWHR